MLSSRRIHIVLASAQPKIANRLLKSIRDALPSFQVEASILLFGAQQGSELVPFCIPVEIIDSVELFYPIVDSRNICQLYLQRKMLEDNIIGFVLDDDLLWKMPEAIFIPLVEELILNGCDMAFSALKGDSPIPKEYTRTSALLDVLMAINDKGVNVSNDSIGRYIAAIETTINEKDEAYAHHDFYSFRQSSFRRHKIDIDRLCWSDFIERLMKGKTTTRRVKLPNNITVASGRERGGATLILNPDVLSIKNRAIRSRKYTSRRSDMIMATHAANKGFKLFNTPPMLEHNRDETFDSHDSSKLIGDILGYALVESHQDGEYCRKIFRLNLLERIKQTNLLLIESSKMMSILIQWLSENDFDLIEQIDWLHSMMVENERTISALTSIDLEMVNESFDELNT